jgi:hypothetical protein
MASPSSENQPSRVVPLGVIAMLVLIVALVCGMCACLLAGLVLYAQVCWT